jgi:hypothetical protein
MCLFLYGEQPKHNLNSYIYMIFYADYSFLVENSGVDLCENARDTCVDGENSNLSEDILEFGSVAS